jgi:hypothetical protein
MEKNILSNYKSILYCTQSNSLDLFNDFHNEISKKINFQNSSFIVADLKNYTDWIKNNQEFEDNNFLIKEWEITSKKFNETDVTKLKYYEEKLGVNPGIFGAIIADRRLLMGRNSSITQDYNRRFTDRELMSILLHALEKIEVLFEEKEPDILVGFISVTFLDYLAYLFARSKEIKILNLRPTRISDRVIFSNTLNDPDEKLASKFEEILNGRVSNFNDEAENYLKIVKSTNSLYEGVVSVSDKPALTSSFRKLFNPSKLYKFASNLFHYYIKGIYKDNHVVNPVINFIYASLINPMKARIVSIYLKNKYVVDNLGSEDYVFFPLHTEPEVSLLVYGRPFVNQIEVIRMIALSMPIGKTLYVKEHPWMVGKRSLSAYKKILNIPRVKLVSPSIESRKIVQNSQLVAVITGSIALEAAFVGKPVITFGDCPYNLLPNSSVTRVQDIRNLEQIINKSISGYKYDKKILISYIAANYEISESINLYSSLLRKKNVHQERTNNYSIEINNLVNYAIKNLKDEDSINVVSKDVAAW